MTHTPTGDKDKDKDDGRDTQEPHPKERPTEDAPVLSEGQRRVLECMAGSMTLRSLGVFGYYLIHRNSDKSTSAYEQGVSHHDCQPLLLRRLIDFAPYVLMGATDFVITPAGRAALVDTDTDAGKQGREGGEE